MLYSMKVPHSFAQIDVPSGPCRVPSIISPNKRLQPSVYRLQSTVYRLNTLYKMIIETRLFSECSMIGGPSERSFSYI